MRHLHLTGGVRGGIVICACKYSLNVARPGTMACGNASGQPLQSDTFFISIEDETIGWFCFSALARVQIEMQAANSHRKVTGRNAAINLLSGKRDINTANIIQIRAALSRLMDQSKVVYFLIYLRNYIDH
jgi:hypothetical protein